MSPGEYTQRKITELRLPAGKPDGHPLADDESLESSPGSDSELLGRTVEAVVQVAGELTRLSASNSQASGLNHTLAETVESLSKTQSAIHESLRDLRRREAGLAATAERMSVLLEELERRDKLLMEKIEQRFQRFSEIAFWTILFAAASAAGVGVTLLFFFSKI